jgi:hypothetical protein
MIPHQPRQITLPQFSATFIPFGLLLAGALFWGETGNDLVLERVKATIWSTSILLNVALVIAPFRAMSPRMNNFAGLYWSFAWLIFLAHAYWAVFLYFGGIAETFAGMGARIAGPNFFLVAWWSIDVVLLWLVRDEPRWLAIAHTAARVFAFLVFAITLVILRGDAARGLGIVFTTTVIVALVVRWLAGSRDRFAGRSSAPSVAR